MAGAAGPGGDVGPEIPRVRSAVDYITRRLAIDWLPYPDRAALGCPRVYLVARRVRATIPV